jgi:hypothetical protein
MCFSHFKVPFWFFSIILTAGVSIFIFGEDSPKAHVAVIRFTNETGVVSYDAACKAATDTLVLTLTQLGNYRVQSKEPTDSGEDALRTMAEEEQLDFIIYGKMSASGSGGIKCVLSVFDRAKGETSLSQSRKAAGVLDIFNTTDELAVSVLESMTGAHIGFGSLALDNTGEKGSYTILVDGAMVGENLASLERVLIGRRTVTIVQKRMLGEREIARSTVDVKEGETAELSFAIPLLMDDEKRKVEGLRAAIETGWNDATVAGDVDAKTMELSSLFGDLSYSPRLSTYKDEATQLAGEWVLEKAREAIEGSAWEPKVELLDAAGVVSTGAKAYPNPAKIQNEFEDEAQLMETLFELQAGNALASGDLNKGLECFGNALTVSIRYLSGNRMADYAYALAMLQSFQEKAVAQDGETDDRDLKTVFGNLMRAGQLFYGLKDQVASGKTCALVASDFGKKLSVDGSGYEEAPASIELTSGTQTLNVRPEGVEKPISVSAAASAKLIFVWDGSVPFVKFATESAQASSVKVKEVPAPSSESTLRVIHAYGSISLTTAIEGTIFLDGVSMGELKAGDKATLDSVEVGDRDVEIHYADGQIEKKTASVTDGQIVNVAFFKGGPFPIQRKSIALKGIDANWAGIEQIFSGAKNTKTPKRKGSQIAGGRICRDDRNIYCRIDFTNGYNKDSHTPYGDARRLELLQDKNTIVIGQVQTINAPFNWNPKLYDILKINNSTDMYDVGRSALGKSFIEIQLPLQYISKYFDFSKPIRARVFYATGAGNPTLAGAEGPYSISSSSPYVDIVIGN